MIDDFLIKKFGFDIRDEVELLHTQNKATKYWRIKHFNVNEHLALWMDTVGRELYYGVKKGRRYHPKTWNKAVSAVRAEQTFITNAETVDKIGGIKVAIKAILQSLKGTL